MPVTKQHTNEDEGYRGNGVNLLELDFEVGQWPYINLQVQPNGDVRVQVDDGTSSTDAVLPRRQVKRLRKFLKRSSRAAKADSA